VVRVSLTLEVNPDAADDELLADELLDDEPDELDELDDELPLVVELATELDVDEVVTPPMVV